MERVMYSICASTPETSVAVSRRDAAAALAKVNEFTQLGLHEIAVTTDEGESLSREQLQSLARRTAPKADVHG
jgi:hypothetical protein